MSALANELKQEAARLGFAISGVCPAVSPAGVTRFREWLELGYGGEMHYLASRVEAYKHPESVLEGVRSIVVLAMPYLTEEPASCQPGQGRVSRYAWGEDYHDLIRDRLNQLSGWLLHCEPAARVRGIVDTAPLLEREFAQLAGLGWIGKNTLLLNKELGSYFFLAALLTDLELEYDQPHESAHCGTCRACLDACPTDAFVDAYVLDARKCISYLTIELKGSIPEELRPGVGDWLLGCDICQEVCPWNHRAPASDEPSLQPTEEMNPVDLAELFYLDDETFRQRFRRTPLWRPKRRGILRNAAIILGNQRDSGSVPALQRGLTDAEPLVREACGWALKEIATNQPNLRSESLDDVFQTGVEQVLEEREGVVKNLGQ